MRHVPPPAPPDRLHEQKRKFARDPQATAWLSRYGAESTDLDAGPSTLNLTDDELLYVLDEIEKRRHPSGHGPQLQNHLHRRMVEMTPKLGQPDWTSDVDDLRHVWTQPEMLRLWAEWSSSRSDRARGPKPNDAAGKAFMAVFAMTSKSTGLEAQEALTEHLRLRELFEEVDATATASYGDDSTVQGRARPFRLATYKGHMKRMKYLGADSARRVPMLEAQAAMFRALCELRPKDGFGKRLLIDGCLMPAWVDQHGVGNTDDEERERRGRTPHAGARMVVYNRGGGKRSVGPNQAVKGTVSGLHESTAFARGYYYVAILDQASGWPLVSMVQDASIDEAKALVPLLSDLYRYYGDFIEPEAIAGDGAWDEEHWHYLCEVAYGIAPVFRHTGRAKGSPKVAPSDSRNIDSLSHEGRLVARERRQLLDFRSFERAGRDGLLPGQVARGRPGSHDYKRDLKRREAKFRIRAVDPGTSVPYSLPASLDWRRLTKYPNYPEGRPGEYAYRVALQTRLRNQMEGHFNRMQSAFRLATPGPDRVRVVEKDTVEGLIRLAELRMCALSLADERSRLVRQAPPSPAPLETREPRRASQGSQGSQANGPSMARGPLGAGPREGSRRVTNVIQVDFRSRRIVDGYAAEMPLSPGPAGAGHTR